jgi:hypothetical protein
MIAESGKSFEPKIVENFLGAVDTVDGNAFRTASSKSPSLFIPDLLG